MAAMSRGAAPFLFFFLFVAILLIATSTQARDKPWPCSQCTNGWVDRMTGMCPYRPYCKIRVRNQRGEGPCMPAKITRTPQDLHVEHDERQYRRIDVARAYGAPEDQTL
jgi:hypothetical protein